MARGRDLPEMFEAFRMQRGEGKSDESRERELREKKAEGLKPQEKGREEVEPREPKPVESRPTTPQTEESAGPIGYLRRRSPVWLQAVMDSDDAHFLPLGQRAQVIFALSYNALMVVIIVFVLFGLLVGFVGYTVGSRWPQLGRRPVSGGQPAVGPVRGGAPAVRGGGPARGGAPVASDIYYRVKVLEVRNTSVRRQAVEKDVAFLKRQRVGPVIQRLNPRTNMIAVFAGTFGKDEMDQAEQLKARVRVMTVDGRREFEKAQVVSVR